MQIKEITQIIYIQTSSGSARSAGDVPENAFYIIYALAKASGIVYSFF